MRKHVVIGLVVLAAVGGLALTAKKSGDWGKGVPAGNPGLIPYTAVIRETATHIDRSAADVTDLTYAYRSDGSYLRRTVDLKPDRSFSERVIQFASGVEITVNDLTNLKSTMVKRGNFAAAQRNPRGNCLTRLDNKPFSQQEEKLLGEENYRGYRVVRVHNSGADFLYALDFGCAHVYDRIVFNEKESSEHNLVDLIPGEPAVSLFSIAPDVREVTPSERLLSSMKNKSRCGPGSNCERRLRVMDEDYRHFQSKSAPPQVPHSHR
jgi:hypothetical protein